MLHIIFWILSSELNCPVNSVRRSQCANLFFPLFLRIAESANVAG